MKEYYGQRKPEQRLLLDYFKKKKYPLASEMKMDIIYIAPLETVSGRMLQKHDAYWNFS